MRIILKNDRFSLQIQTKNKQNEQDGWNPERDLLIKAASVSCLKMKKTEKSLFWSL